MEGECGLLAAEPAVLSEDRIDVLKLLEKAVLRWRSIACQLDDEQCGISRTYGYLSTAIKNEATLMEVGRLPLVAGAGAGADIWLKAAAAM